MISKNKIKQINSLSQKKYRSKNKLFLVEGNKMVKEVIQSEIEIEYLVGTKDFLSSIDRELLHAKEIVEVSKDEINKASLLVHPQQAMAICKIPELEFNTERLKDSLTLCLDTVQDPGNLGTIVRIADWYGIKTIFASPETADLYNPKVIQASMGAFCRVNVVYTKLTKILESANELQLLTFGTFMEGDNIYTQDLPSSGIVVMGNEGKGISKEIEASINKKLHIPGFQTSESLNVAVATAIICSEFKRNELMQQ